MKEIKKSASFTSKQKGKDVKFNIDLNYSPEYDSFIIKVKEGEGFMAYSSNIERMPLEVIQKLNEMLEEVLVQAGSKTEMMEDLEVELGAEPNPNHSSRSHEGSVKIKTYKVKVKSLSEAQNKVRGFIEQNDLGAGNFTGGDLFSHGKKIGRVSYNGRVWNLKDEPMKMADGGNFQSGVYEWGGRFQTQDTAEELIKDGYGIYEAFESYKDAEDNCNIEDLRSGKVIIVRINNSYCLAEKRKMLDGGDFQAGVYNKGGALKNERLHVNKDEDYEVRYSKPRPHRKGYKGLRNFNGGGEMDLTDDKRLRLRKPVMPERKLTEQEWAEKYNPRAYEFMGKDKMAIGGGVNVGYNVFNYTDDIYATDEVFKTKTLANKFIKEFRNRFVNQGYYRDNRMNKINIEDIDLLAIPSDFNPYKKYATGGGVGLVGNQKRIDMNKNGKIDAEDFKLLRSSMNGAWRNEHKHVNHNEDYEVRYAKPRPKRTGYKGKRNFIAGGKMEKCETGTEVKKGVKGGIMTLAKKIRKDGEKWTDAVKRAGQQLK